MTLLDLFNASGTLASWVGLIVSIGALVYAKSAAQRAQEARDAVEKHYIQDAWRKSVEYIRQLEEAVRRDERALAIARADDLRSHLTQANARYQSKLTAETITKLVSARSQLRSVTENLQLSSGSIEEKDKKRVLKVVGAVREDIEEECGYSSAIEQTTVKGDE